MKKIALLTSGGDAPGMNAAVRAIVKSCLHYNITPVGIKDGFDGLINEWFKPMDYDSVNNIIHIGGTILGSARSQEFRTREGRKKAIQKFNDAGIEGLIVIGGDGSFKGAQVLSQEMDLKVIGLPGTIDNDLYGTDATIGYDTALNTAIQAIDKIRDTATSHRRVFFIEVMGRHSGFLALNTAIASGAESVLIPETVSNLDDLVEQIKTQNKGKRSSIVVVAEGDEAGGALDIMRKVSPKLEGFDLRTTILGHIQRGGSPSYFDRALATRSGVEAVELLRGGKHNLMVGIKGDDIVTVPLDDAIEKAAIPDISKEDLIHKLRTK